MSRRDDRRSRLYGLLLRLYPRPFRERFGRAMAETFAEERAHARRRGLRFVYSLWMRTLVRTPLLALEERVRERRDGRRGRARSSGLASWVLDLRSGLRSLRRSPGFVLVTVLTVALSVGATAALFSLVDAFLLRPLPVRAPERLVRVQEIREVQRSVGMEGPRIGFERYEALDEATTGILSGLAGHNVRYLSMRVEGPAFRAAGVLASGNYFGVLGLRPALGRFFSGHDEPVVVLSHRLWQGRLGGAPDVVGRTVHLEGEPFTVVGVAGREFGGTVGVLHADVWVPHGAHGGAGWPEARVSLFGRLAPGVEASTAEEALSAVARRLPVDGDPDAEVQTVRLEPLTGTPESMAGPVRGFLGMLLGTALLVLLVAGANVAGMLLARTARRRRELAVRLALGVGRGRLFRQAMLETVALFVAGGAGGMLVAAWATRALARLELPMAEPVVIDVAPDARVLGVALAVSALTGLIFGLMPALQAARSDVAPTLRDGGHGASRSGGRARDLFVAAQVAVSVLLLIGATLFVRTVHGAATTDPGFEAEGVVVATVDLPPQRYDEESGRAFYRQLVDRVRARPEAESVALARVALLTGASEVSGGWRTGPDATPVSAGQNVVDARYFETMGIDLAAGRGISATDAAGAPRAAVVNEAFARRLWPGENPLGKVLLRGDDRYEVVGVTRDGAYVDFGESPTPFVFLSSAQHPSLERVLHVRRRPGSTPAQLVEALRAEVAAIDPDVALEQPLPLPAAIGFMLFPQRFAAALIGLFGLLGLALASVGIYGVLAQHVAQRTRELGIRVALGADARRLLALVLRRGVVLTLVGTTVGLAAAAALTRFLESFLYGVDPLDAPAFVGVPLLLGAVTLLAGTLPAWRALGADPVEVLRRE